MAADAQRPPRSRSIPAALHTATLNRLRETNPDTARPFNCSDVAVWLAKEHGVAVSRYAVERLRAAIEKHTEAQVIAAMREEFREAIGPTKKKLTAAMRKLDVLVAGSTSTRDVAAGVNAISRVLHELATLSGVAAPAQVNVTNDAPINLVWPDAPVEQPADGADGTPPPASPAAE